MQVWSMIAAIGALGSAIISLIVCLINKKQNKIANAREQPNLRVFIPDNDTNSPAHWFYKYADNDCIAAVVATFINPTKYPVTIQMCYLLVGNNSCVALQNHELFDIGSLGLDIKSVNGLPIIPNNISFPLTIQPYGCIDSYAIFPTFVHSNTDILTVDFQVLATFGDPDRPLTIHNISLYNLNNRIVEID